jgi:hypothetical protein
MRSHARSLTWKGQSFRFQRMSLPDLDPHTPLWAVSRQGEFIGVMPCSEEITTKDFDVRGLTWLRELFQATSS